MTDTIRAKYAYRVVRLNNKLSSAPYQETLYRIDDGIHRLLLVHKRSIEDFRDERENNEMFKFCEVFTTSKGNQYIYWRDEEIDADYITQIKRVS